MLRTAIALFALILAPLTASSAEGGLHRDQAASGQKEERAAPQDRSGKMSKEERNRLKGQITDINKEMGRTFDKDRRRN